MQKLLVVLGPTATGKTDLALSLAKKFNGELIACDSRQVYKKLDIGTGKLPSKKSLVVRGDRYWKINEVKVWMYDLISIKKQYTVADYIKDATEIITKVSKDGKLPIIVGGTGLYFRALVYGLPNLSIPFDQKLRKQLGYLSKINLQQKLQKLSFKKWEMMNNSDRQNTRRLTRAIELSIMSPYKREFIRPRFDSLKIGLTAPRSFLYKKINERVLKWIQQGIVDEVKNLINEETSRKRIKSLGLEYAVIVEYLEGRISYKQMIEKMQIKTRQYAKRQITYFKKEKDVFWFDISEKGILKEIEKLVHKWYYNQEIKYA